MDTANATAAQSRRDSGALRRRSPRRVRRADGPSASNAPGSSRASGFRKRIASLDPSRAPWFAAAANPRLSAFSTTVQPSARAILGASSPDALSTTVTLTSASWGSDSMHAARHSAERYVTMTTSTFTATPVHTARRDRRRPRSIHRCAPWPHQQPTGDVRHPGSRRVNQSLWPTTASRPRAR